MITRDILIWPRDARRMSENEFERIRIPRIERVVRSFPLVTRAINFSLLLRKRAVVNLVHPFRVGIGARANHILALLPAHNLHAQPRTLTLHTQRARSSHLCVAFLATSRASKLRMRGGGAVQSGND